MQSRVGRIDSFQPKSCYTSSQPVIPSVRREGDFHSFPDTFVSTAIEHEPKIGNLSCAMQDEKV